MPKSCIICSAVASPDVMLQYCAACQSAMYCSRACQRKDWKKRHRGIYKLLNVGHGDMQVRTEEHTRRSLYYKERFEEGELNFNEDMKRFFKLFKESTFEGSRAATRKMKKVTRRQTKLNQNGMIHRMQFLVRSSNSEMLSWRNSPLLVMLEFINTNMPCGGEESAATLLHMLTDLADPFDYSTHVNQLIVANQIVKHGANVNAVANAQGMTPLHKACTWDIATNLDFVELLLEKGADPNAQDHQGLTPSMYTRLCSSGATKFLLNWPTTDVNITNRSGESFLAQVRFDIKYLFDKIARPDNLDHQVPDQFLLQQWRDIEEILVERGAADNGISTLE
jgi:hypothetical protein